MECMFCKTKLTAADPNITLEQKEFGEIHRNTFCNVEHLVLHALINRYGMKESEARNLIPK